MDKIDLSHGEMLSHVPVLQNPDHFEETLKEAQRLRKIERGGQGPADRLLRDNGILEMKIPTTTL